MNKELIKKALIKKYAEESWLPLKIRNIFKNKDQLAVEAAGKEIRDSLEASKKIRVQDEALQMQDRQNYPSTPMTVLDRPTYGGYATYENDPNIKPFQSDKVPAAEIGGAGRTSPENMLKQIYGDVYLSEVNNAQSYNEQNNIPGNLHEQMKQPMRVMYSGKSGKIGDPQTPAGPNATQFGVTGINLDEANNLRGDDSFHGFTPLRNQNVPVLSGLDDRGGFMPMQSKNFPTAQSSQPIDYTKNTYEPTSRTTRFSMPGGAVYEHELTHGLYPRENLTENDYKYSVPSRGMPKNQHETKLSPSSYRQSYFGSLPDERVTGIAAVQRDTFNRTGKRFNSPEEFKNFANSVLDTGDVEKTLKGARPDTLRYFRNIAPIPVEQRTKLINQDAFKAPGVVKNNSSTPKVKTANIDKELIKKALIFKLRNIKKEKNLFKETEIFS